MKAVIEKTRHLENMVKKMVIESVQGFLRDPDFGLELREGIVKRLKKYSGKRAENAHSLDEVRKQYF